MAPEIFFYSPKKSFRGLGGCNLEGVLSIGPKKKTFLSGRGQPAKLLAPVVAASTTLLVSGWMNNHSSWLQNNKSLCKKLLWIQKKSQPSNTWSCLINIHIWRRWAITQNPNQWIHWAWYFLAQTQNRLLRTSPWCHSWSPHNCAQEQETGGWWSLCNSRKGIATGTVPATTIANLFLDILETDNLSPDLFSLPFTKWLCGVETSQKSWNRWQLLAPSWKFDE